MCENIIYGVQLAQWLLVTDPITLSLIRTKYSNKCMSLIIPVVCLYDQQCVILLDFKIKQLLLFVYFVWLPLFKRVPT